MVWNYEKETELFHLRFQIAFYPSWCAMEE